MNKMIGIEYDNSTKEITVRENVIRDFKDLFSGCHINFLLGAGYSANILGILNNKELVLEALKNYTPQTIDEYKVLDIIKAYVYWDYFIKSIYPISNINKYSTQMDDYYDFSSNLYRILSDKSNPVLNKQANIFTTNYDPIIEMSIEESKLMANDGFEGRIEPKFLTSNYSVSYYREAFYTNRKAEMPSVNIFKIHGSVNWSKNSNSEIVYSDFNEKIDSFYGKYTSLFESNNLNYLEKELSSDDKGKLQQAIGDIIDNGCFSLRGDKYKDFLQFLEDYKNTFLIVNPTKEKFSDTLLNRNYYELLRMFSNEMEKENTLLVVIGFSFADEHIQDLLKRSMINPSLKIIIFCYKETDISNYEVIFSDVKSDNISYIYLENSGAQSIAEINCILKKIHI